LRERVGDPPRKTRLVRGEARESAPGGLGGSPPIFKPNAPIEIPLNPVKSVGDPAVPQNKWLPDRVQY